MLNTVLAKGKITNMKIIMEKGTMKKNMQKQQSMKLIVKMKNLKNLKKYYHSSHLKLAKVCATKTLRNSIKMRLTAN
jgi:hypothetical protein